MKLFPLLAILAAVSALATRAGAATYYLGATFGSSSSTILAEPYIGSATLSYEAPSALADGSYAFDSFSDPGLTIVLGNVLFGLEHLLTPRSEISIEVRGGGFYFGSIPEAGGSGPRGGAADFINGESELSTAPYPAGVMSVIGTYYAFTGPGSSTPPPLYYAATPVPEPSLLAIAGAVLLVRRRR